MGLEPSLLSHLGGLVTRNRPENLWNPHPKRKHWGGIRRDSRDAALVLDQPFGQPELSTIFALQRWSVGLWFKVVQGHQDVACD